MNKIGMYRMDASGCNGCDIEILSAVTDPKFGVEGVEVVDDPSKASVLLVTGGINVKTLDELSTIFSRIQEPRTIIAVGTCASSMCVFKGSYPMRGPLDERIKVNLAIVGCPPRPQNLALALMGLTGEHIVSTDGIWVAPEGLRGKIAHDADKCTACGACARCCPSSAIDLSFEESAGKISFNMWKCSFCGTCQDICPDDAVRLTGEYAMWHADKRDSAVRGEMERARCAQCGSPMHAKAQAVAIKSRIAKNLQEYKKCEKVVDDSLQTCTACKEIIGEALSRRKKMASWAYE